MKKALIGVLAIVFMFFTYTNWQSLRELRQEVKQSHKQIIELQGVVSQLYGNVHRNRPTTTLPKPTPNKVTCDFNGVKYLVNEMELSNRHLSFVKEIGYLNFSLTKANKIAFEGVVKGERISGLAEHSENILLLKDKSLSLELKLSTDCGRIKSSLVWQIGTDEQDYFYIELAKS